MLRAAAETARAQRASRQRYTDGVIDDMLAPERVTYEDLARASSNTTSAEPPSLLKGIFHDASGNDGLLAAWLVNDARDADIVAKEATRELVKLVKSRLGLELPEGSALAKLCGHPSVRPRWRFPSDLTCPPPACLEAVATPQTKDHEAALHELAHRLRTSFPEAYAVLADRVEEELGLRNAKLPAGDSGAIDTFRFEERSLLSHCGDLIANQKFDEALVLVGEREHSFWLNPGCRTEGPVGGVSPGWRNWEASRCRCVLQ